MLNIRAYARAATEARLAGRIQDALKYEQALERTIELARELGFGSEAEDAAESERE
jgi:hypothetical protein